MIRPDMKQFLAFVESRAPDRPYEYDDWSICACGQFAAIMGVEWFEGGYASGFWMQADNLARHGAHKFGALAERVRAHIAADNYMEF